MNMAQLLAIVAHTTGYVNISETYSFQSKKNLKFEVYKETNMKYIVDKLPTRPVDCPFYGFDGGCDFEHGYACCYFQEDGCTGNEDDCLAFRTFNAQLHRAILGMEGVL